MKKYLNITGHALTFQDVYYYFTSSHEAAPHITYQQCLILLKKIWKIKKYGGCNCLPAS